jgi:integrase
VTRANGARSHYVERGKHVVAGTIPGLGRKKVRKDTEAEAWVAFAELEASAKRLDLTTKTPTVGQLATAWMNNWQRGKAEASTKSTRAQRVQLHILDDPIANLRAKDLTPADVEAWLSRKIARGYATAAGKRKRYAPSTIRDFRLDLSQIMGWGMNRRVIEWNPVKHIDAFSIEEQGEGKRTLTPEQAAHLIRECLGTARSYATFVLATLVLGARPGEIAGLRWDRIDFDAGTVKINQALKRRSGGVPIGVGDTKTKTHRTVTAPGFLLDALRMERKLQDEAAKHPEWSKQWRGLVFLGKTGTPPSASNLRRSVRRIVADAGLDIELENLDPYELRHTCASLLDHNGVPVNQIIDQMGWSDDRMFYKHYRHKVDPVSGKAGAAAWETMLSV